MIFALIIGRKGSSGFPNKNLLKINNKPLAYYPIQTLKKVKRINKIYMSTDDERLITLANQMKIETIKRPKYLATKKALGEDVFEHGYKFIKKKNIGIKIKFLILMFCNAVTITNKSINEGIDLLLNNTDADSAVTVSEYNMWSPLRARKLDNNGFLKPFVPFKYFGNEKTLNCDRDSQGSVFFADMGCSIVRPKCLDKLSEGLLPQKWMGKKILPIYQEAGFDLDYNWQVPSAEWWINNKWDSKE